MRSDAKGGVVVTKVLVCGGRDFGMYPTSPSGLQRAARNAEVSLAFETLDCLHVDRSITMIINGGARGADELARHWASRKMIDCHTVNADWKAHGKAAGPIRNQKMLDEMAPDLVVAFPGGSGTADMVRRAKSAGVEVIEVSL